MLDADIELTPDTETKLPKSTAPPAPVLMLSVLVYAVDLSAQ
jgi:hypothetical protein